MSIPIAPTSRRRTRSAPDAPAPVHRLRAHARATALVHLLLGASALLGCAGPSESTPATEEAVDESADERWWHGTWVIDAARLRPDDDLSPAARQTARALAATFAGRVRYELGPERVRRLVADRTQAWSLAGVSVRDGRAVLDLVGGGHLVLERGPSGVVLSDGDGSRPVARP